MKILVISDTHGYINNAITILEKEKFDYCIHLGDMIADCEDLESIFPRQKFVFVKGNNDFWNRSPAYPDERFFTIDGVKIFACHGHRFHVKSDHYALYAKAKELEADIALFGHTHSKCLKKEGDITFMNPGSKLSYGVIVTQNGNFDASLHEF
ncbi:MAG: metallophosphoesterase [Ruminococcaceae bacterium]|nr:metallophosphoesterase [Oscillospiraceae bacterium]